MTKRSAIALALLLFFSITVRGMAQSRDTDPYCPQTDGPVSALDKVVQQSPRRASAEIGGAAIRVYETYMSCADEYKKRGNREKYMFAVAQGSGMFIFAAEDYNALGDRDRASAILQVGIARDEAALSETVNYEQEPSLLRSHFKRYREELVVDLQKMRHLQGMLN